MAASGRSTAADHWDEASGDEPSDALASSHDQRGTPLHRGWAPLGGRRRWMEPFVLMLLTGGGAHGYGIIAQL